MSLRALQMPFRIGLAVLFGIMAFGGPSARAQFGLAISGVGPINRSMGGASVAAPLDSAGAIFWNPATMGALGRSEMEFGTGFLIPRTTLSSFAPANSLGPGTPPVSFGSTSMRTGGNNGVWLMRGIRCSTS